VFSPTVGHNFKKMTIIVKKYYKAIEKTEVISKWLLLKLANKVVSTKDIYLRNSIAKSSSLLISIGKLYRQDSYNDGWVLYRSLIDRLVYIYYLTDNDLFDQFEDWTYIQKYEYRNNVRADEKFKRILNDPGFNVERNESNKYRLLKEKGTRWVKPIPKTVLKNKDLDFLYKFGYDIASMDTHPMATDGDEEFYQITGLKPNPYKKLNHEILLKNSILVFSLINQVIFNKLNLKFRGLVYSFLEETRKYINEEPNELDNNYSQLLILTEKGISWFE